MYFKRKSETIFRDFGAFGYITDNRNFGYQQDNCTSIDIGDKIVSQSGAVFLSVLGDKPQTLDDMTAAISSQFKNVDKKTIKNDAIEFYRLLEKDGFVMSGNTYQECVEKDICFTYKEIKPKDGIDACPRLRSFQKDTQEYFEEYFKGEPLLTHLHLEIASACNERCVHCYIPHENKNSYIEPDLFYSIIEQSRKMNLLHLTISGGEPLMHEHFVDFLDKCNEYNFSINVLSNLTQLNNIILAAMKRNHLLCVQTSLYSMDPQIHDAITQVKGSFKKTISAILKLWENDIPMQISCPIMKQNVDCYTDVVDWGRAHNIKVGSDYVIIAKYNHMIDNLQYRLSAQDIKLLIQRQVVQAPQYLELLKNEAINRRDINPDNPICSVCHSSICIADNGDVYPCAGWQDYIVGNLRNTSLIDIWTHAEKVKYLRDLRKRDFPKCLRCPDKDFCTMCMVRNSNEHPFGDPLVVSDYFCDIARITKAVVLDCDDDVKKGK